MSSPILKVGLFQFVLFGDDLVLSESDPFDDGLMDDWSVDGAATVLFFYYY